MWIDTNNCEEEFHEIVRRDGKWFVLHSFDDNEGEASECTVSEFDVSDLVEG